MSNFRGKALHLAARHVRKLAARLHSATFFKIAIMLTTEARSRLTVVLVGARNPQNIGAAARAMQDFGFSDLRVVNEFAPPFEAAQLEAKSAVGAGEVMRSARLFSSLPEAIADCTLVAGTTAIGERGLRLPIQTLREAAIQLLTHLNPSPLSQPEDPRPEQSSQIEKPHTSQLKHPQLTTQEDPPTRSHARVALLFGSEKTGLTNDQLSHCSLLLTIPLFAPEGRHLSMNLGQAVAVCLYELSREGFEGVRDLPEKLVVAATSADRERLTTLLLEVMESSGYTRRFPANARHEIVRQLTGSLGRSREEAGTWMGLFRHLLIRISRDLP